MGQPAASGNGKEKENQATCAMCVVMATLIGIGGLVVSRASAADKKEERKMMWCHACGFNLDIPGFRGKSDI